MDKPPMEWIDKLFSCMAEFYGDRWTRNFSEKSEFINKAMWQSALFGCTHDEIRNVLVYLKRQAKNPASIPPHALEFWKYTKSNLDTVVEYRPAPTGGSTEVARRALDEINAKIRYRKPEVLRGTN
jgi:hypothetical protein